MIYKDKTDKPYFLWDYDLTEQNVRDILSGKNAMERRWIIARILSNAHFRDVWKYLTINEIVYEFSNLKLRSSVKEAWQRALTVWGYHV